MSQIKVQDLTFSYEGSLENVFEKVSLTLDTDWKLGFIGRNGRGKTTFLKILAGELNYSGKIITDAVFGYFPFKVKDGNKSVAEIAAEICPDAMEWELVRELNLLGVEEQVLCRSYSVLSDGEKTKVLLAALFLKSNVFMLIDEPTNHLDERARASICGYLSKKRGFILVSHDRELLDGCTDHILSLNAKDITVGKGNFSVWFENKKRQDEYEKTADEKLEKEIDRLSRAAKRGREWSERTENSKFGKTSSGLKPDKGYVGHKAAKMMKSALNAERRLTAAAEEKKELLKNVEEEEKLALSPLGFRGERLFEFKNLSVIYDGRAVLKGLSFSVSAGERVRLAGANGCGKSSVLKLLLGEDIGHTGEIYRAANVKISYVAQNTSELKGTLYDYIMCRGADKTGMLTVLAKMGVGREQFEKRLEDFSEGQKKKVLLAASISEKAHVYVWDEPLNYIDVMTRLQIEKVIEEYCPTMVFVEHDKTFAAKIATKTVML